MRKLPIVLLILAAAAPAMGQVERPAISPKPGMCLIQNITPEVYETKEERILVRPAYKTFEVLPAEYETVDERVMIKPPTKKFVYVPAEYKTVTEEVIVEDAAHDITVTPPQFTNGEQTLQIRPKTGRWEYKYAPEDCYSTDPRDCMVMQYVEHPAELKTIPVQTRRNTAVFTEVPKAEKHMPVQRQVEVSPARVEEIEIPGEYMTVTHKVLVHDAQVREIEVPAEYRMETVYVLKDPGGLPVWEEIDCKLTEYNLLPVYFETGSARLNFEARQTIDGRLLQLLLDKPNIRVEIAAHTDARGAAATNLQLSQERVEAIASYLAAKGIQRSRLVAKGFGETRLKNKCRDGVYCSEAEHAQNRRIEYRVLSN
jgi:OmpA-OmpF porin, OOP family